MSLVCSLAIASRLLAATASACGTFSTIFLLSVCRDAKFCKLIRKLQPDKKHIHSLCARFSPDSLFLVGAFSADAFTFLAQGAGILCALGVTRLADGKQLGGAIKVAEPASRTLVACQWQEASSRIVFYDQNGGVYFLVRVLVFSVLICRTGRCHQAANLVQPERP